MKFKKGDVVHIKRGSQGYGELYDDVGFIVVESAESHRMIGVTMKNHSNPIRTDGIYYFQPGDLEHVTYTEQYKQFIANFPSIKDVIFNEPAVIVLWNDGTKTVVKCSKNDIFDPEKGLAMAISKKALGNQGNYYNIFKKYLPEDVDDFGLHPDLDSLSGYSWMNKAIENLKDEARQFVLNLGK